MNKFDHVNLMAYLKYYPTGIFLPKISIVIFIALMHLWSGCSTYDLTTTEKGTEIEKASITDKYILIHHNDSTWLLKNPVLFQNRNELYGTPKKLTIIKKPLKNFTNKHFRPRYTREGILKEKIVYLFITDYEEVSDSQILIPYSAIIKTETYNHEYNGPKTFYYIMGFISLIAILSIIPWYGGLP
ncbi:MAG: hypothetical protein HKN75_10215 [Bacteroidia bacterium]|nr:hypothetical protein [Bacteroidia bacterium]